MKSKSYFLIVFLLVNTYLRAQYVVQSNSKSIRSFGVLPENNAEVNQTNLQKAIDWAASSGAALFVEPTDKT